MVQIFCLHLRRFKQTLNINPKKMKKFSTFAAAVFAASVLVSCEGSGPEAAVKGYLTALKDKKVDDAKKFGTETTQNMLETLNQLKMLPEVTEIKDIKCNVQDTTATCTFCCMKEGKNELKLVKRSDKWLVDEKKEGGGDMEMKSDQAADSTATSGTEPAPAESQNAPAEGAAH